MHIGLGEGPAFLQISWAHWDGLFYRGGFEWNDSREYFFLLICMWFVEIDRLFDQRMTCRNSYYLPILHQTRLKKEMARVGSTTT